MLKSKFSSKFKNLSIAVGKFFSLIPISPNAWTLLSLLLAVPGFVALYYKNLPFGLFFFFISGLIDFIDGAVARATKKTSVFGAFLDGVIDRYVEFLLYLGLWAYLRDGPEFLFSTTIWILLLLFGAMMPSFIRAYAHHRGLVINPKELDAMGGLLERSERLDLLYIGMILGYFNPLYLVYMIALVAALSHLTAIERVCFAARR